MKTQINIPIYRALKLGTKDEYVEGSLLSNAFYKTKTLIPCCYIFVETGENDYDCMEDVGYIFENNEIDPSTLAIHFPNMIANDSDRLLLNGEKDLRIFASISEDGKGGDKIIGKDLTPSGDLVERVIVAIWNKTQISFTRDIGTEEFKFDYYFYTDLKVTGIKE